MSRSTPPWQFKCTTTCLPVTATHYSTLHIVLVLTCLAEDGKESESTEKGCFDHTASNVVM